MKDELLADAKKFGDARRSPLVARGAAQALDETELVASEPMTVVLSEKGWVRAAKGHDVDAAALGYREGDGLLAAVRGRSTQQVAFLDSTGRSYSTAAHTLPCARGNGEPLTGRFAPPPGASFQALATGDDDDALRARVSSHGYGFVTALREPHRPQEGRQGDAVADAGREGRAAGGGRRRGSRPRRRGHQRRPPAGVPGQRTAANSISGKGNKLIEIPKAKLGTERVVAVAVVPPGGKLSVKSGSRTMTLVVQGSRRVRRRIARRAAGCCRADGRRSMDFPLNSSHGPRRVRRDQQLCSRTTAARQKVDGLSVE